MKKISAILISLLLVFVLVLPVFAANITVTDFVDDQADILSDSEEALLENKLEDLSNSLKCAIYVVTRSSIDGQDIEAYTDDLYDYNGYGYGDDHTGVIMLLDMSDRAWHVSTTGRIIENLQPYIKELGYAFINGLNGNNDYYSGFTAFADTTSDILTGSYGEPADDIDYSSSEDDYSYGEWTDTPESTTESIVKRVLISVVIGFVLALIVSLVIRGKNKSVHFQKNANNYEKQGSFVLRNQYERFLYHTVTRTEIRKDDDDHHSGGSFGGGSIHVGSSGTSHGGGCGHF